MKLQWNFIFVVPFFLAAQPSVGGAAHVGKCLVVISGCRQRDTRSLAALGSQVHRQCEGLAARYPQRRGIKRPGPISG